MYKKICIKAVAVIFSFFLSAFAQTVSIPHLESTNIFFGKDKSPFIGANSETALKLRLTPSYVFYFDVGFKTSIDNLFMFFNPVRGNPPYKGDFNFFSASFNFPHIKNRTVSVSVFTGDFDELGTDSLLQEHLKTKIEEPRFRKYYPGYAFKPQKRIDGLGFTVHGAFQKGFYSAVYAYWNERTGSNLKLHSDFRFGGSFNFFNFDFFAGALIPLHVRNSQFRSGISMLFTADEQYSFFAEAGLADIPLKKLSNEDFIKSFYALFEARIKRNTFSVAVSSFLSPVFLLPAGITDGRLKNTSYLGVNTLFTFGDVVVGNMEGGVSVLVSVNPQKPALITPFSFSVTPFYTIKVRNVEMDFRLPINPLLYDDIKNMFVGQISLKAVF